MRFFISIVVIVMFVAGFAVISCAASQARVTYLEGSGSLIRGASRYNLVTGVTLQSGDIMECGERTQVLTELADGSATAFGSSSRVLWASLSKKDKNTTSLFLLAGSIKVAVPKGAVPIRIETPHGGIVVADAVAVVLSSAAGSEFFAETGTIKFDAGMKINGGEYCISKAGNKPVLMPRPPQTFVAAMPIPFRDALPRLISKVGNSNPPLAQPRDFSYDEVELWLNGPPRVRKLLTVTWRSKATDAQFRKSLVQNLKKHPEWESILFPEKKGDHEHKNSAGSP